MQATILTAKDFGIDQGPSNSFSQDAMLPQGPGLPDYQFSDLISDSLRELSLLYSSFPQGHQVVSINGNTNGNTNGSTPKLQSGSGEISLQIKSDLNSASQHAVDRLWFGLQTTQKAIIPAQFSQLNAGQVYLQGKDLHRDVHLSTPVFERTSLHVSKQGIINDSNLALIPLDNKTGLLTSDTSIAVPDKVQQVLSLTSLENPLKSQGETAIVNKSRFTISTPLNQPGWSTSFASRIIWMAAENIQSAQININPPELGPVEIRLNQTGEQTNIQFISQHAQVRDAIEESVYRLRELMNESGINLGDTNVTDQSLTDNQDPETLVTRVEDSVESATPGSESETDQNYTSDSTSLHDYYV